MDRTAISLTRRRRRARGRRESGFTFDLALFLQEPLHDPVLADILNVATDASAERLESLALLAAHVHDATNFIGWIGRL